MPIYEYRCAECRARFEKMRPMSQAGAPIACAACGHPAAERSLRPQRLDGIELGRPVGRIDPGDGGGDHPEEHSQ